LGALGVVFGDIGTSPLYALQTVFSIDNGAIRPIPDDVYGVLSLVFWSILLIVSVKYVVFVMRAGNDGEGGIMALAALIRRRVTGRARLVSVAVLLGVIGASLFFGDSVITPAISVLSAVEGIEVVSPGVHSAVLPIGVAILVVLFVVQRFGTHRVGRLFGPVMLLWFVVLAALGIPQIVTHPGVLRALSPTYAVAFGIDRPLVTFLAMGAVELAAAAYLFAMGATAAEIGAVAGPLGVAALLRSQIILPTLYESDRRLELAERGARESREREEEFFERCRAKLDDDSSEAVEVGTEA